MTRKKKPSTHRQGKAAPSIVDVALALNVSAATVSRALNDHPRISKGTTQRVKEKAAELGYVHNRMASSLRNAKSGMVGLIVPRISMFFHAEFITSLQNQLHKAGYQLIIAQSNDVSGLEKEMVDSMFSSQVDALVISISLYTDNYAIFDKFIQHEIPLVFYDRVPLSPIQGTYTVVGADYEGGRTVATHLAEQGATDIAYISGPLGCNLYRDRTLGFRQGLAEKGLGLREEWVFHQELTSDNAWQVMEQLFANKDCPDAIFACNDNTAIIALQYAIQHDIQVPKQLKIVGYSNDPRGSIIKPGITTIDQYPHLMAQNVCKVLLNALPATQTSPITEHAVVTPISLTVRESSICTS